MEESVNIFTDNPVNWVKWGVVFIVLAISFYLLVFKLYYKINWFFSVERKIEKARVMNNTITGKLVDQYLSYHNDDNDHSSRKVYRGKYEYMCNGKRRIRWVRFTDWITPPSSITLYYLKNPKHTFCDKEPDKHQWLALIYLLFILSSFLIAGFFGVLLGVIDPTPKL